MPLNVSVIYSVTDRSFPYWSKNSNLTARCINEITPEENDTEKSVSERKEGTQANAHRKKAVITIFVIDKAFFVLFLKC